MQINFGGNTKIGNAQFSEGDIININSSGASLRNENWDELQHFLDERLKHLTPAENEYAIAREAAKYARAKDETGLKGLIKRNKETFFTNVLSNLASSGLVLALSRLCL